MLDILFFNGDQQFFSKLPGINFLYDRVLTFLFISRGGIIWDREALSAKLSTWKATGAHPTGALGQGVYDGN